MIVGLIAMLLSKVRLWIHTAMSLMSYISCSGIYVYIYLDVEGVCEHRLAILCSHILS